MLKIRSGDKEAQSLVRELVAALTDAGAFFHPALQIDIRGAEFSFASRKKLKGDEVLVTLPLSCMPVWSDFEWSLDGDQHLCWAPIDSPLAGDYELNTRTVDLLIKLYNRFGKLADYSCISPVVQFAHKRPLIECLLAMDHDSASRAKLDEGHDQLMIHSFWHSRIFSDYLTGHFHLIPVMEFFDHNVFADNFFWDDLPDGRRALHQAFQRVGETKAVYARYEIMDSLHAFMKYGFVDDQTFFLQSQPFSLQLSETILLDVRYQSSSGNQCHVQDWQANPAYSNSIMYRSRLEFLSDTVVMPFLLMPPQRHMPAFEEALVAQLREIERYKGMLKGELANSRVIRKVKGALLKENEGAYRSLASVAQEAQLDNAEPVVRMLKKMLSHQVSIIKEFKQTL